MYSALNTLLLSEYTYFYISKTLLYTLLLLVFKIIENLQCILNGLTTYKTWQLLFKKNIPLFHNFAVREFTREIKPQGI